MNLILVDVDGVLNPETPTEDFTKYTLEANGYPYKVWLNPEHGEWLKELAADTNSQLVWCTFWEHNAPVRIAPILNLPEMPFVPMKRYKFSSTLGQDKGFSALSYVPEDTRFAYFDDEYDISEFFNYHWPASENGLHVFVDPDQGLQRFHIQQARNWLLA